MRYLTNTNSTFVAGKISEKESDIQRQSDSYDYPDVGRSNMPPSEWTVFKVLLKKQFIYQYRDWVSIYIWTLF